jgi:hypothetical protein
MNIKKDAFSTLLKVSLVVFTLIFVGSVLLRSKNLAQKDSSYAAGATYYVDCANGSDANDGTSISTAWRSISKANNAPLAAGEKLLFKRGCVWSGTTLRAKWNGSAASPITIGAYGTGDLPIIQNAVNANVNISGTYQIIEQLQVQVTNAPTDPNCVGAVGTAKAGVPQTYGFYTGFNFTQGSSYNILRNSKARLTAVGVHFSNEGSHHNKVLHNEIIENNVMYRLDPEPNTATDHTHEDRGGSGMDLKGNDNEVAYNYLKDNVAWCNYDIAPIQHSNSIELFNAKRNYIHHNISINDRVFSEVGGDKLDKTKNSEDNTFAYNLHTTSMVRSRFLTVHGIGREFGPSYRTKLFNNTLYHTSNDNTVINCVGCDPTILTLKNNIVWGNNVALRADGPFNESNNIYWKTGGSPTVSITGATMSSSSRKTNPLFVNPGSIDFHLNSSSFAINNGVDVNLTKDLENKDVPINGVPDIGGYEYGDATPTLLPTPAALPTVTASPTESSVPLPTNEITDFNNPTVSITYPVAGEVVPRREKVVILAEAADDNTVASVKFYIDTVLFCTDTLAPYQCQWSLGGKPNNTYNIRVVANDQAGNKSSDSIDVISGN